MPRVVIAPVSKVELSEESRRELDKQLTQWLERVWERHAGRVPSGIFNV